VFSNAVDIVEVDVISIETVTLSEKKLKFKIEKSCSSFVL
jgi:hypothetical protein